MGALIQFSNINNNKDTVWYDWNLICDELGEKKKKCIFIVLVKHPSFIELIKTQYRNVSEKFVILWRSKVIFQSE